MKITSMTEIPVVVPVQIATVNDSKFFTNHSTTVRPAAFPPDAR
jgi:hypothetical protein